MATRVDDGLPYGWADLLDERVGPRAWLDGDELARVNELTVMLAEGLHWEAARGFEVTDEMILTIAGTAALPLIGLPDDAYGHVHTVVVHPGEFEVHGEHHLGGGIVTDEPANLAGLTEDHGPVVLAWDAVRHDAAHPGHGHNVVIHEFAHQLDLLDGVVDGTPPLGSADRHARWSAVCTPLYRRLAEGDDDPVLDPYAGSDPGEFFAVASEVFLDNPLPLRSHHRHLYEVLADFYGQDPAVRVERGRRRYGGGVSTG